MQLPKEYPPPPDLAHFVKYFWLAERDFGSQERSDILPDSYVELIFTFSGSLERETVSATAPSLRALPRVFVVGLLEAPLRLQVKGTVRMVGVGFFAWGVEPGPVKQMGWGSALEGRDEDGHRFNVFKMLE